MRKYDTWHLQCTIDLFLFHKLDLNSLFGLGNWILKHPVDLDYYSCRMTVFIGPLHPICQVGLVLGSVGIVSDVGPSQVLFWFRLFPFPGPFLSFGREGDITLLDCRTNTTGWCMRKVSSGRAAILQEISGLARQELCTICTDCMKTVRGEGLWAGGGKR